MRICSGPGCLRAVPDDVRFCDECKPASPAGSDIREHSISDRIRYAFLYSGSRWQRTRAAVIRKHPLCDRCGLRISEIADHVVPAGVVIAQARVSGRYKTDRYAGFYLMSNLQGLCRVCHWAKTEEDKLHSGAWPDAIEREAAAPRRAWTF